MDLGANVLAEGNAAAELDAADGATRELQVHDRGVDVVRGRHLRKELDGAGRLDLGDLGAHEEAGRVELMGAHVEHDPAAGPRVEDRRWRRIHVVLPAREQEETTELPGDDPGVGADVVRVVPTHEPDLQPDPGSVHGREDRVGVGQVERQRLLAQDVPPGGRGRLDDLPVMDGRDRDEHGIDARRRHRSERIGERRGADLVGEVAGGAAVHVTDRDDPQLRRTGGDQLRVAPAHPPGTDDRQADPRRWHPAPSSMQLVRTRW